MLPSRKFLFILFFSLLSGLSLVLPFWWLQTPQEPSQPVIIKVESGQTLNSLSQELQAAGLIDSPLLFQLYVRVSRSYPQFQAGSYAFEGPVSPQEIKEKMTRGEVFHPLLGEITLAEGLSLVQVQEKIAELFPATARELTSLLASTELLQKYEVTGVRNLEGFLYPATYSFYDQPPTANEIISRMVDEFFRRLPPGYRKDAHAQGLTLLQAVTMASLIEKETSLAAERTQISEVLWRRLKSNMPLGIDAAVIYGIVDYQGDLKTSHLKDRRNPYNLRIHKGLPPTPICSPSLASLAAVLKPTDFGYYYYVLKSRGSKGHFFSKTLQEHNFFVRRLVNSYREE